MGLDFSLVETKKLQINREHIVGGGDRLSKI